MASEENGTQTDGQKKGPRTHFKIGSRKSKLAMVQSEDIMSQMQKLYPDYTFEIINFDTKGDQILNIALPKIGDKGLFTKELEDALENSTIDFVVHSLKDMPCQMMPANLVIAGIPERENPHDALVVSNRLRENVKSIDDLEENSTIGTSSLRRISQLKLKYPKFKFETIRGNLQTRFAKLDDEKDKKFDAIILAAAGLRRLDYKNRITQILDTNICMYAVSQGALGVQCRKDDSLVVNMLNRLNDEETVLRCIAERTFLAKLEGGCSAPIGISSRVTENSISLEGAVFDLEGTVQIKGRFEIDFDNDKPCPIVNQSLNQLNKADAHHSNLKRKLEDDDENDQDSQKTDHAHKQHESKLIKRLKSNDQSSHVVRANKDYSFILDLKIDEAKLIKAELCGLHLAEKLRRIGADVLIKEIKQNITSA